MIGLLLTLDYELYGNGSGEVASLITNPTRRLIEISNEFDAKITIFAEVAEFMAMRQVDRYKDEICDVETQLQELVKQGHDVQLHLHPQWFGAEFTCDGWQLNYNKYSIADIDCSESCVYLKKGIEYLETLLREANPNYKCVAFRAGNWCMTPSGNIIKALKRNGIIADTSVYKWGREIGQLYSYDYTNAYSNVYPWFASDNDINEETTDAKRGLLEIPIYTENAFIFSMINFKRLKLRKKFQIESQRNIAVDKTKLHHSPLSLSRMRYPRKFDFCKLTYSEMKKMVKNLVRINREGELLPVCSIGHSKDFIYPNDYQRLLKYIRENYSNIFVIDTFTNILREFINAKRS